MRFKFLFTLAILVGCSFLVGAQTLDISKVPGKVIFHSPASSGKFPGSPTICILPNGDYIATCDFFGNSAPIGLVFKSNDKGETWTKISEVPNHFWCGLFYHNDALYLMGSDREYGNCIIRRSLDGGQTWTTPSNAKTGLLIPKTSSRGFHTSTTAVVIYKGRIWRAMENAPTTGGWGADFQAFMMSAPVDADLLNASSWTVSNYLAFKKTWKANHNTWLEGNAVVAPDGLMKIMPRVDYRIDTNEKSALIDVSNDGATVSFDPANFINFPGGCKKFTVRYDSISGKYWALSNYVPDECIVMSGGYPIIERGRNTQALCSSSDLKNWTVNSIYLQHYDIYNHGFQYVDWLIEGEDLVVASRTAFDDGIGGAQNCHNANMFTFHRIKNFRTMTMDDRYVVPNTNGDDVKAIGFENSDPIKSISVSGKQENGVYMSTFTKVENPNKSGINQSDSVMKFVRDKDGYFLEGLSLYFNGVFGYRNFLHVMVYTPDQLTAMGAILKDRIKEDVTSDVIMSYKPIDAELNQWYDVVIPLSGIRQLRGVSLFPDRDKAALNKETVYYIDNLELSDNMLPRKKSVTKDDVFGTGILPLIDFSAPVPVKVYTLDRNVKVSTIKNGNVVFSNRGYIFQNVCEEVNGWSFTSLAGGVVSDVVAEALEDGYLYCLMSKLTSMDLTGWEEVNAAGVINYNDNLKTKLYFYRKACKKGDRVNIPQYGWTGSMVCSSALSIDNVSGMELTVEASHVLISATNHTLLITYKGISQLCKLGVYDLAGHQLLSRPFTLSEGVQNVDVDLSSGYYVATLEGQKSSWKIAQKVAIR